MRYFNLEFMNNKLNPEGTYRNIHQAIETNLINNLR
jgi:hypothetical protein